MPERTCSVEGCLRAHRARDLCSTHYNQTRYTADQRHPTITVQCDWCGKPCQKNPWRHKRYAGMFCSLACRDAWRLATGNNPYPSEEARRRSREAVTSRTGAAKRKLRMAAKGTRGSYWVAGSCEGCGCAFVKRIVGGTFDSYCSDTCFLGSATVTVARLRTPVAPVHLRPLALFGFNVTCKRCGKREWATERRDYCSPQCEQTHHAKLKAARHALQTERRRIYERDGGRCGICKKPIRFDLEAPHPLSPTLDHVIPRSKDGSDDPSNLRAAHFLCNSTRGNRGGNEQLALFG